MDELSILLGRSTSVHNDIICGVSNVAPNNCLIGFVCQNQVEDGDGSYCMVEIIFKDGASPLSVAESTSPNICSFL